MRTVHQSVWKSVQIIVHRSVRTANQTVWKIYSSVRTANKTVWKIYRKHLCISHTFLLKFGAKNRRCGLYTRQLLSEGVKGLGRGHKLNWKPSVNFGRSDGSLRSCLFGSSSSKPESCLPIVLSSVSFAVSTQIFLQCKVHNATHLLAERHNHLLETVGTVSCECFPAFFRVLQRRKVSGKSQQQWTVLRRWTLFWVT